MSEFDSGAEFFWQEEQTWVAAGSHGGEQKSEAAAIAGDAPSFALTEEEKQYKGEAEDGKALMAHLRWVTEREQQLQQQKDVWQAKQRSSRAGKASPATAVGKVGE